MPFRSVVGLLADGLRSVVGRRRLAKRHWVRKGPSALEKKTGTRAELLQAGDIIKIYPGELGMDRHADSTCV